MENLPALISENEIDQATYLTLKNSIYPGAKDESIVMAVQYCRARQLDPLLKPVHLVPMNVKNAQTGKFEWRDVVLPGIGLYRIQADRAGNYAGADAPQFAPTITLELYDKNNDQVTVNVPESCTMTVYKLIDGNRVGFTHTEYWEEAYATDSGKSTAPNAMWKKRARGQLAKVCEAQCLRKGWPELGSEPTYEEMHQPIDTDNPSRRKGEKVVFGSEVPRESTPETPQPAPSKSDPNKVYEALMTTIGTVDSIEHLDDMKQSMAAGGVLHEDVTALNPTKQSNIKRALTNKRKELEGEKA